MKIAGISYDGGYQQYTVAPVEALAAIPESINDTEAAPLLCAGVTTFNALRHSGASPGDIVAVQGIGGLGHLGIQFANKFGYRVAAIGRGPGNAALAKKLGASVYIDSRATNAAEELQKLGGAQVILATAPSSKAMTELIDGLGPNGKLMVIGAAFDPIEVTPIQLISGSRMIQGWASGTAIDSEDTLRFAELTGVRPMIETYPLEKAAKASRATMRWRNGSLGFRISPCRRSRLKPTPTALRIRIPASMRRSSPVRTSIVTSTAPASGTTCPRKLRRHLPKLLSMSPAFDRH